MIDCAINLTLQVRCESNSASGASIGVAEVMMLRQTLSGRAAEDLDDVELDALLALCEKALLALGNEKRDEGSWFDGLRVHKSMAV
jgi:hypothetical protein